MWWWTLCKRCGADMSQNAQVCPVCGAVQNPPSRGRMLLWSFALLIVLGAVGPILHVVNLVTGRTHRVVSHVREFPDEAPPDAVLIPDAQLAPAVAKFIASHPEFGPGKNPRPPRTWFGRERQIADSSKGSVVFYIERNEVVAVRRLDNDMALWSKQEAPTSAVPNAATPPNQVAPFTSNGALPPPLRTDPRADLSEADKPSVPAPGVPGVPQSGLPQLAPRPRVSGVPAYSVLEVVKLFREPGGRYGSILVPTFSKTTPIPQREALLKYVMEVENLTEASLYCSAEAYRADLSERYARTHPRARLCSLGGIFHDLGTQWF